MSARVWTCRKCGSQHPRTKQVCGGVVQVEGLPPGEPCPGRRPTRRPPKHQLVLDLVPYEVWVDYFGERCGICGRPPANVKLHRDHDHRTGDARGLLCHRCNRALPDWITVDWLMKAVAYLSQERKGWKHWAA